MASQAPFDVKPFNLIETRYIATPLGYCSFSNSPVDYKPWVYRVQYDKGDSDDPWSAEPTCFKDKVTGTCPYMELVEDVLTYNGNCPRDDTVECTEDAERWAVSEG